MMAAAMAAFGCGAHPATPVAPAPKLVLAVMPAESMVFPGAATAASNALAHVQVKGIDEIKVWKASLEVVQMQIECVDTTPACYVAAGKELHADRLLFAQIGGRKQVDVTVTLFDVASSTQPRTAHDVFDDEAAAIAGIPKLVAEATKP
jgi:hypothetical protein